MKILGMIIMVVGAALILAGRNVAGNIPPDYQGEDDGSFLKLLQGMGKMLSIAGIIFILAGLVCIMWTLG